MNYPSMEQEYNIALGKLAKAVGMAREGKYREGYLMSLLDGIEMLKQACMKVGKYHRDGKMLDSLTIEFKNALEHPESNEPEESPLAGLFYEEGEHEDEAEESHEGSPLEGGNPHHYGRRGVR